MRYFLALVTLALIISGCSYTPFESLIQTAIAGHVHRDGRARLYQGAGRTFRGVVRIIN
jgi:hypothetical protein